jgi:thiamine biosynthesis lipoprotein ApbE
MHIHIALYKWKETVTSRQISQVLQDVEFLATKVTGILDITTGKNTSKYGKGYTHVILVRGKDQAAIDAYRNHPGHSKVARIIDAMEDRGIGVDFSTKP